MQKKVVDGINILSSNSYTSLPLPYFYRSLTPIIRYIINLLLLNTFYVTTMFIYVFLKKFAKYIK
jgi:hypothetical protein